MVNCTHAGECFFDDICGGYDEGSALAQQYSELLEAVSGPYGEELRSKEFDGDIEEVKQVLSVLKDQSANGDSVISSIWITEKIINLYTQFEG